MSRLGGGVRLLLAVLALLVLSPACATTTTSTAVPAAPGGPPAKAGPRDPEAPATYRPVVRSGPKRQATLQANRGGFSTALPVKYSDGVSLKVRRLDPKVERATGPGAFPGRPYVAFSFSLENKSRRVLDLNQVVVTAVYGVPGRLAQPVYEDDAGKDFAGVIQPGESTSATYSFAVPNDQRRALKLIVDIDDVHLPAQFTGVAR